MKFGILNIASTKVTEQVGSKSIKNYCEMIHNKMKGMIKLLDTCTFD